ncbi:uncharacterized protein [Centruroides vittatus]|uniref:uncharacterized protein n=1 Tax=Centruroides vittatus TaxID=120091 RepID=UPI0035101DC8
MGRKCDISDRTKDTIVALHKAGRTQKETANYVKCSQPTVPRVLKQQNCVQDLTNKRQKCGRKQATIARDERNSRRIVVRNRFKGVKRLHAQLRATGVNVSSRTTCRRLYDLDFNSRVPKTKPSLTEKQRQVRVRWCRESVHEGTRRLE